MQKKIETGFAELLHRQPSGESDKDKYIAELQSALQVLLDEVHNLDECIALLRKKQFGSSSEKTPVAATEEAQLGLFSEAEQEFKTETSEPIKKDKRGYHYRNALEKWQLCGNSEIKDIYLQLPPEQRICPNCGTEMKLIGKEMVREVPEFIPAKLRIVRYWQYTYACPECKKKGHLVTIKVPAPKPLLNHSMASASVVAEVMYQKYVNAVPLYRQEVQWKERGVSFSRTTMANWVIRCAEDWLAPLWNAMHEELLKREVLHADETVVQVLKENGKTAKSKAYMWVYRTGNDGKPPIILFEYQPGRSGEYPKKFLEGFHGYLHTDGYAGYNQVPDITRCGCWAHLRRKFVEAMPATANPLGIPSQAEVGRNYCDQLFAAEQKIALLCAEKRQEQRLAVEQPMLRAFWCWLDELEQQPLAGNLKKAVQYAQGQRPYMENYLNDPRCQLSNNLAENAIRPFTVGRKNWLFSDSVPGAKASAIIYSLVETAKANKLAPEDYLRLLLENLPDMDIYQHPEKLQMLFPWSDVIRENFE